MGIFKVDAPSSSAQGLTPISLDSSQSGFARLWRRVHEEIRRPSLLSNSSDLDEHVEESEGGSWGRKGVDESSSGQASAQIEDGPVSVTVIDDEIPLPEDGTYVDSTETATSTGFRHSTAKRSERIRVVPSRIRTVVSAIWWFFDMRFPERSKEKSYQRELYYGQRQLAVAAAIFFTLTWILVVALTPKTWTLYDKLTFIGMYGIFSVPLIPMIYFNVPHCAPLFWQVFIGISTWTRPTIGIIDLRICVGQAGACGEISWFIVSATSIGQAVLGMFGLGLSRFPATIGVLQWFALYGAFTFDTKDGVGFIRNGVYFLTFHIFLLAVHCIHDRNSRRLFEMREQLKLQYRATQRAQVMEKKAMDLTKRFVSYIFHEVRVPLNTALLTLQNLDGEHAFGRFPVDQRDMVEGMRTSLAMMDKVLNDVLSFNRMESGAFRQVKAPFDLTRAVKLTADTHQGVVRAKGLSLETKTDPNIGLMGSLHGDEMRLRQILSNLVSNAVKFTEVGDIRIETKLLYPKWTTSSDPEKGDLSSESRPKMCVVRIEVHDTGIGLRPRDVQDNRLFSPYVQTEVGRRQGGKGTGLGLALVRQLVKSLKGRLGVESEAGKGSTFWFELPYSIVPNSKEPIVEIAPDIPPEVCAEQLLVSASAGDAMDAPLGTMDGGVTIDEPATMAPVVQSSTGIAKPLIENSSRPPASKIPLNPSQSHNDALDILVVDDDKLTRMMMARMLKRLGHRVDTAENGQIALDKIKQAFVARETTIDVVFLDNQMPLMTGVEVASHVRQLGCPVYIVGCTGNALRQDQAEYLQAGADRILTKPIKQAGVEESIAEARRRLKGETVPSGQMQVDDGAATPCSL